MNLLYSRWEVSQSIIDYCTLTAMQPPQGSKPRGQKSVYSATFGNWFQWENSAINHICCSHSNYTIHPYTRPHPLLPCIKVLTSNSSSTDHNCWRESRDDNSTLQLNKNSTHVATDTGSQLGSTDHCRDHSRMWVDRPSLHQTVGRATSSHKAIAKWALGSAVSYIQHW